MFASAYTDTFAQQGLPAPDQMAQLIGIDKPPFAVPEVFNCAIPILDNALLEGHGDRICVYGPQQHWTYADMVAYSNQVAHWLGSLEGWQTGSRVLLRGTNSAELVACWFGVIKAGGIAVSSMPLLRAKELEVMVDSARISVALCDHSLANELEAVQHPMLQHKAYYGTHFWEQQLATFSKEYTPVSTFATDIALIGFTSGTTGLPKMTAHYHRDVWAICQAFPPHALRLQPDDVVTGTPPIAFTFGLGGLVLFPFCFRAATVFVEKPSPEAVLQTIAQYGVSICFTAPTAWRAMTALVAAEHISRLRCCVSAGETLPAKVWHDWKAATGLSIIDGIGATEMLHIFISAPPEHTQAGATGKPIPGYEACILDDQGQVVPAGTPGRLAVRGVTGCKYLYRPEKQAEYVQQGWNLTGDIYRQNEQGYLEYVSRSDDMIISSGYNIAAHEVETVLLQHPDIAECAVVGTADEARGMLVTAHVVLRATPVASEVFKNELQHWFKQQAAPYKYPRLIFFHSQLPKTETGKLQRFKLKHMNHDTL